jgi:hypothetical protein
MLLSVAVAAAPPVVGGQEAEPGKWPVLAAPYYSGVPSCTGVLIHPELVLTAGHCDSVSLDGVLVGAHDRMDLDSGSYHELADHIAHDRAYDTYDVTVLVLAEAAPVEPAELAIGCAAAALADGADAWVVGWGSTDPAGNDRTNVLHEVLLPVLDADCDEVDRGCNPEVSPGGELIAGGDGLDSCVGDSGGPLFVLGSNGRPYLAGITSRAAVPASVPCGDGGIYVRVDAVADWVEDVTGRTLAEPDCSELNRAPQPEDATLSVWHNKSARMSIAALDPDNGQSHSWSVEGEPQKVTAAFEGSDLVVTGLVPGVEVLTVVVSDGDLTGSAEVTIKVVAWQPEPRFSCGSVPASPWRGMWLGLMALVGLTARRCR